MLDPITVLQVLVNGILLGALYACIGLGFSLVWGVMNVINLSHGAFVMLGAYITFWLWSLTGMSPFATIPISMIGLATFGYLVQILLINYIVRAPRFMTLIVTWGLLLVIVNLALLAWTADYRSVDSGLQTASISMGALYLPKLRLLAFGVALLLMLLLHLLLRHTMVGRAIVATRMDLDAARLMGIPVARVYAITFAIGAALAAAAGSLISMLFPISPVMGGFYTGKSFVVCVLGGLGSVSGALVGGLLLGVVETLGALIFGVGFQDAIGYLALILVLLVSPLGIMGERAYE